MLSENCKVYSVNQYAMKQGYRESRLTGSFFVRSVQIRLKCAQIVSILCECFKFNQKNRKKTKPQSESPNSGAYRPINKPELDWKITERRERISLRKCWPETIWIS